MGLGHLLQACYEPWVEVGADPDGRALAQGETVHLRDARLCAEGHIQRHSQVWRETVGGGDGPLQPCLLLHRRHGEDVPGMTYTSQLLQCERHSSHTGPIVHRLACHAAVFQFHHLALDGDQITDRDQPLDFFRWQSHVHEEFIPGHGLLALFLGQNVGRAGGDDAGQVTPPVDDHFKPQ